MTITLGLCYVKHGGSAWPIKFNGMHKLCGGTPVDKQAKLLLQGPLVPQVTSPQPGCPLPPRSNQSSPGRDGRSFGQPRSRRSSTPWKMLIPMLSIPLTSSSESGWCPSPIYSIISFYLHLLQNDWSQNQWCHVCSGGFDDTGFDPWGGARMVDSSPDPEAEDTCARIYEEKSGSCFRGEGQEAWSVPLNWCCMG